MDLCSIQSLLVALLYICRSWLLGITQYGTVWWQDVYNDSVEVYAYYDIPLQHILYLYFVGGHQLLLLFNGPLDMPYSVEVWCISTFGGDVKLNTHRTMGPMMEW